MISGSSPFCQTFFDNVKVPKQNLVGQQNHGWTIAKRLLQHERQMIAGIGGNSALGATGRKMEDIAKEYVGEEDGRIADAAIRSKITGHRMNDRAFQLTLGRSIEEAKAGRADGNLNSMFKYYGTEQNKRKYEVLLETMGTQAVGLGGCRVQRSRTQHDAAVAALESEFDRRRHQRGAAERHRKTRVGSARLKPPLSYSDGVVTIRRQHVDDLEADLAAKDDEQIRWLWLPGQREQWQAMTRDEQRAHAARTLTANHDAFGTGPKWCFSVDSTDASYVAYIDFDLANEHVTGRRREHFILVASRASRARICRACGATGRAIHLGTHRRAARLSDRRCAERCVATRGTLGRRR